jgi:hypothetical protein
VTLYRGYEPARTCTSGPEPGAKALMAWFLGAFAGQGGKNLGIFNCRQVRGGSTTSLHGEGRACDLGINPHGAPYGTLLAERLRLSSGELGIQCLIWNRRIWSGSYPDAGWRHYSGTNAHVDHIHLELSRAAARSLTPAQIQRVLSPAPRVPLPQPAPRPPVRKDEQVYVKHQPDPTKPDIWTALLVGPFFIGLNANEVRSADGEIARGATCQWVERATWDDLDRRSKAIARINTNTPGGQS